MSYFQRACRLQFIACIWNFTLISVKQQRTDLPSWSVHFMLRYGVVGHLSTMWRINKNFWWLGTADKLISRLISSACLTFTESETFRVPLPQKYFVLFSGRSTKAGALIVLKCNRFAEAEYYRSISCLSNRPRQSTQLVQSTSMLQKERATPVLIV